MRTASDVIRAVKSAATSTMDVPARENVACTAISLESCPHASYRGRRQSGHTRHRDWHRGLHARGLLEALAACARHGMDVLRLAAGDRARIRPDRGAVQAHVVAGEAAARP